jgi:hypothetical protein
MAHMICTCALRCYWECLGEHLKNPLGIWLEHTPPFPQPITSKLKRKVKIKINLVGMHVKASRWPHEIFIFKIVCHHFQHKSMGTSSYCVRIESIKSFVSFNFLCMHGWKLGTIIVDDTISQPLGLFSYVFKKNFQK